MKPKILFCYLAYPFALASYFRQSFERREDIELFTCGAYTGSYIPWNGGINLPSRYVFPVNLALPADVLFPSWEMIRPQLSFTPDVVVQIDAGWHFKNRPQVEKVITVATDPHCISGDTLLATDGGILYAHEASIYTKRISNKLRMGDCDKVIYKGFIPTRKFTLETGQILNCTDDHLIETREGFIEARELRVGDEVLMSRGTYYVENGTDDEYSRGFILGAFQGDGSFGSSDIVKFTIAKKEKNGFGQAIKEHLFYGFGVDIVTEGKHYTSDNAKVLQVRRWGLYRFLKSMDIKGGKVPLFVRKGSMKFIGGYIAGLFAADGCSVNGLLQLTLKDEQLIREIQIILFYLGIITRIKSHISGLSAFKPGNKYWTLYVSAGNSGIAFHKLTGEIPGRPIRLDSRKRDTDEGIYQYVKILDIEGAVKNYANNRIGEPVYDVVNSDTNSFLANGVSVHNCLNYDVPRSYSDYFFNMQKCYSKPNDIYLPYAADQHHHHPAIDGHEYDAALIGLHYPQRTHLVEHLRQNGYKVLYDIGLIYDEYREANTKAEVGLNWSSLQDLPARVFEIMAMNLVCLTNRIPDLPLLFEEGKHYLGFDNVNEAKDKMDWIRDNPEAAREIAMNGYEEVVHKHTYDLRVETMLKTAGII